MEVVKELLGKVVFWVCLLVSLVLIVLGFVVPPLGLIDPSVLTAVGEVFAFATLGVVADAIKEGYNARVSKGDVSVEIGVNNKEEYNEQEFQS